MKETFYTALLVILSSFMVTGQEIIAAWTFPTGTSADSLADQGISTSIIKTFSSVGTSAIDFTKNGFTTKAAQATGWDSGMDKKYWMIVFSSLEYDSLTISSKQQSGGNNPGPRDWRVQYRIGFIGSWTNIPDTRLTCLNDWTTGVLENVPLPDECSDKDTIYIRWIMKSDTSSAGAIVLSNGIAKIDDIVVRGVKKGASVTESALSDEIEIFPNPTGGLINIISDNLSGSEISISGPDGKVIIQELVMENNKQFDLSWLTPGIYFIRVENAGKVDYRRIVLLK